ncbi:MAG: bifunctional heptose 7-phosphate kinase/heptose 1-phosphate adenyltransferase, partial [Planctomycetota bacterium]
MTVDLLRAIEELPVPDVVVVGDLILDRYVTGRVDRISPEAPIQVLRHSGEYRNLGGMAAVAGNLARLGAKVRVVGLIGTDLAGNTLRQELSRRGVGLEGLVVDGDRPTTVKTRFVAESQNARQQILRVDRETDGAPGPEAGAAMLEAVKEALPAADMLVISDYGKGALAGPMCRSFIEAARLAGVKVIVDPKGTDFARY